MHLHKLTDSQLLADTKELIQKERQLLTDILKHLGEVERRRLFSELGYRSLFDYATKELGYSEDQAYRRINAMRMIKTLPAVEQKIESGDLSLTNLSLANSLFKEQEKKSTGFSAAQKMDVLKAVSGKSRRDAEVVINQVRGHGQDSKIEINFKVRPEVLTKIEQIKGWVAHSHPCLDNGGLLELLCDQYIDNHMKNLNKGKRTINRKAFTKRVAQSENGASRARSIPVATKRQVWRQAGSRCEKCNSSQALQIDHIHPVGLGGDSQAKNLRLLCRSCNQREAIKAFGLEAMTRFLVATPDK